MWCEVLDPARFSLVGFLVLVLSCAKISYGRVCELVDVERSLIPRENFLSEPRAEYVGEDMAVGTLVIQIPIRVLWWLKWVADREKTTPERLTEILVMRKLESMSEIDLSRSPRFGE